MCAYIFKTSHRNQRVFISYFTKREINILIPRGRSYTTAVVPTYDHADIRYSLCISVMIYKYTCVSVYILIGYLTILCDAYLPLKSGDRLYTSESDVC